ncbi:hypothetical protein [Actinomycetospora cinnamomea]|uniref:Uncharacterized protein n=1 Tax=Actinomycetospora cinnamomea TaxID=663609 RepID=A0A2U1FQZ5_9PSEU|nr:hypothetical protein [Actinomycetospora cinnamomea]PVZ14532.1 hypothetical protein C8D89_101397 [Actinomycetospora cinnamomea]
MSEEREPDIEFRSTVRGRRLRFEAVPDVRVDLTGDQDDASRSGSERENLPDRVRRHVTYTDVRVDHATLSWLDPPDA